jgi:hypothetical protein
MELSSMEYKKIAHFYNIPKPSNKTYKEIAEDVLAGKLCKCIKKVKSREKILEKAAIGICRESIFKNRGIDFYTFKCKKGQKLISKQGTKKQLNKFRKKIGFNKTKKSKKNN